MPHKGFRAAPLPRLSLPKRVREFTEDLKRDFSHRIARRPKAFKPRLLALISINLPRNPKPTGRPREARITEAASMYLAQLREIE
jgi:hypothetical protein